MWARPQLGSVAGWWWVVTMWMVVCADPMLGKLERGVALQQRGELDAASKVYGEVLGEVPEHPDALHLLGLVAHARAESEVDASRREALRREAVGLVERASGGRPTDSNMLANLGEVRRAAGDLLGARRALELATGLAPASVLAWRNLAAVALEAREWTGLEAASRRVAALALGRVLDSLFPPTSDHVDLAVLSEAALSARDDDIETAARALADLGDALQRQRRLEEAARAFKAALELAPSEARAALGAGVVAQQNGNLDEAAEWYAMAAENGDGGVKRQARVNLASVHHERGDMERAIAGYEAALVENPDDAQALNNMGAALMTVSRHDEAVRALERCLRVDGDQLQALTNLATHFANEGDRDKASALFARASRLLVPLPGENGALNAGLLLREVAMMAPTPASSRETYRDRAALAVRVWGLRRALARNKSTKRRWALPDPVSSVEQVHFYLPYAGLNDRFLQQAFADVYRYLSPELRFVAPGLVSDEDGNFSDERSETFLPKGRKKARIGFVSKFFGEHEPHGLLLEGVVEHLPRDRFYVLVLPIASPGRPAASKKLVQTADELVPLGLNFRATRAAVAAAHLDVCVFADMLSEPMSYFLGFGRFAPVQVVFWGNPVTAGRPEIDYFVSADRMEGGARTALPDALEPYSEQVVLLQGQGIWYRAPADSPKAAKENPPDTKKNDDDDETAVEKKDPEAKKNVGTRLRSDLGLPPGDWTLLVCAQSNFKLHPRFDGVLGDILARAPNARVVLTEGRRPRWTAVLKARLNATLEPSVFERIVFLPRQPPGPAYMRLLAAADVMLHPFPFGGSRTSSDGLAVGLPVVTRPVSALRGRMAYSFFATMGMTDANWTCVAENRTQYVDFAVKLANDPRHRSAVAAAVVERAPRIWEDREVVFEWARFLARVTGVALPTPSDVGWHPPLEQAPDHPVAFFSSEKKGETISSAAAAAAEKNGENSPPTAAAKEKTPRPPESAALASWSELASEAVELYAAGKLVEAAETLRAAVGACDERAAEARLRSDLGATLQQLGMYAEAEVELRASVALNPQSATALNNLAVTLHEAGRVDESRAWYESALAVDDDGPALVNAANALRDSGDPRGARDVLLRGLGLSDAAPAALALLEPANHHLGTAAADEAPTKLRASDDRLAAANALVVLDDHIETQRGAREKTLGADLYAGLGTRPPFYLPALDSPRENAAPLFGHEPPPTEAEMRPLLPGRPRGFHLVVQPYAATDPNRRLELAFALARNLAHPRFDSVHVLAETDADLTFANSVADAVASLNHTTATLVPTRLGHRLTVADVARYAARVLVDGEIVVFANADVFFDRSLDRLGDADTLRLDGVIALLRWEWTCTFDLASSVDVSAVVRTALDTAGRDQKCRVLRARVDSQDAWIFQSPLAALEDLDFQLGRARCDNHVAARLEARAVPLASPSLALRALHIQDRIRPASSLPSPDLRSYSSPDEIKGSIRYVPISEQWLF